MNRVVYIFIISFSVIFFSCKKGESPDVEENPQHALLILNEGLFQQNNASLTYYDFTESYTRQYFFQSINNRFIGDTGNDMIVYGNKIYIVVNVSGQIEVISKENFASIGQISMIDAGQSRQPRFALPYQGKVWITSFDGTVAVIDTTSLEVTDWIQAGKNPEGIHESGGYIFVANSGGLDFPNYDSTVSVIDPISKTVTNTITIGINPASVARGSNGEVLVLSRGNYTDVEPALYKVHPQLGAEQILIESGINALYNSGGKIMVKIDTGSEQQIWELDEITYELKEQLPIQVGQYETFYNLIWSEEQYRYFVFDAKGYTSSGRVDVLDVQGKRIVEITTGLVPKAVVPLP